MNLAKTKQSVRRKLQRAESRLATASESQLDALRAYRAEVKACREVAAQVRQYRCQVALLEGIRD